MSRAKRIQAKEEAIKKVNDLIKTWEKQLTDLNYQRPTELRDISKLAQECAPKYYDFIR